MRITSENRIVQLLARLGQLVILNFLTLLCCVPIITVGAALTACYECMLSDEINTTTVTSSEFFRAFYRNFRQATGTWIVFMAILFVAAGDIYYGCVVCETKQIFFILFGALLMFVSVSGALWVFPLIARYENKLVAQWKNALLLAFGYLPRTLLLWLAWAVPVAMTVFWDVFTTYLGWLWFLVGFSGILFLCRKIYIRGLGLTKD